MFTPWPLLLTHATCNRSRRASANLSPLCDEPNICGHLISRIAARQDARKRRKEGTT